MELLGLGDGEVALAVVAVFNQRALDATAFHQNGFAGSAANGDIGGNQQAGIHLVRSRSDDQRVAGAQHVGGFLESSAIGADDIRVAGLSDRDGTIRESGPGYGTSGASDVGGERSGGNDGQQITIHKGSLFSYFTPSLQPEHKQRRIARNRDVLLAIHRIRNRRAGISPPV